MEYAEQEGFTLAEVISRRKELTELFLEVFNRFSAQHRVVLALDTAERLDIIDPTQEYLGLEGEHPFILNWLVNEFLPAVQNTVVLVAGRPGTGRVRALLESVTGKCFLAIELAGFTEEEALQYFDAVAALAQAEGDSATAETVSRLDEAQRRTIFYALCDEQDGHRTVRPILLALAVDHMVIADQPLEAFRDSLEAVQQLSAKKREAIRVRLSREIFRAIRQESRPADELILHLAMLPKGADEKLLALISEFDEADVREAFGHIQKLSFVKVRPDDQRLFLHDEMYALLRSAMEPTTPLHRQRVLDQVIRYYTERIRELREKIAALYAESDQHARLAPQHRREIGLLRALLRDALVEDLYYTLEQDPRQGFEKYFRYAEDAVAAYDDSLDMQLRAELWGFLAAQNQEQNSFDGLKRAEVEGDAAVRWIKRLINRRDYRRARQAIERLRAQISSRLPSLLSQAELKVWEALLLAEEEEYEKAERLLQEIVRQLEGELKRLRQHGEPIVRAAGILARAYNNLGYVRRLEGRYYGANEAYERAQPLWRFTKIDVEQANTLNNRAYVLARVGAFDVAWQLGWDAFELRQHLGPRVPVGLSLNTIALIKIEENDLEGARPFAEQAMQVFTTLNNRHGQGLAHLALAEINRRISDWVPYIPSRTAELLERAVQHAEEAVHIFREEIPETDRLIEALVELGCDYRDWAKWRRDHPDLKAPGEEREGRFFSMEELAEKGRQALEEAAHLAEQRGILYRRVNALLNLAWLRYYTELYVDAPAFEDSLKRLETEIFQPLEESIPQAYRIIPREVTPLGTSVGGPPQLNPAGAIVPLLKQLGKLELLRGQIAFNRFLRSQNRDLDALRQTVEHYTLSLSYDTLLGRQIFRDMRRAMERMYERLRKLNVQELRLVYKTVDEVEQRYGLAGQEGSIMRRFLYDRFGPPDLLMDMLGLE